MTTGNLLYIGQSGVSRENPVAWTSLASVDQGTGTGLVPGLLPKFDRPVSSRIAGVQRPGLSIMGPFPQLGLRLRPGNGPVALRTGSDEAIGRDNKIENVQKFCLTTYRKVRSVVGRGRLERAVRICSLKNEALGRFEDIWDHQRLDRKSIAKLVHGLREIAEIVSVGDQSLESEFAASQHFQSQPECVPGKEDSLNTNFLTDGVGLRKSRLTGIVQAENQDLRAWPGHCYCFRDLSADSIDDVVCSPFAQARHLIPVTRVHDRKTEILCRRRPA